MNVDDRPIRIYLAVTEGTGPFPGVVITPGSVQGSEGMYEWLAQDLAERGYVVLLYDPIGQGERLQYTDADLKPRVGVGTRVA